MKIATHNGPFHADDAFSVAALLRVFPGAEVVRTRDAASLSACDLRVDVGGVDCPLTGDYDHHQRGGAGARESGTPYSSFGLVWRHYGAQIAGSAQVAGEVDRDLVEVVDAGDTGTGGFDRGISLAIHSLNPTWEEGADFDAAFGRAVELAGIVLERAIAQAKAKVNAADKVRQAMAEAADARIIVLGQFMPWQDEVCAAEEPLLVIYPSSGTWMLQAVPPVAGSFEKRLALPEAWAGLRGADLDAVTGVEGGVFAHIGRFIAGHTTRDGAVRMAELALQ